MTNQISNSGGTLVFERIIGLVIRQTCNVAVRPVPKRAVGEVVDKGTYVYHPMTINLLTRLTKAEKDTLFTIHNTAEESTLTFGDCTYTGWFEKPIIRYEHCVVGGADRSWRTQIVFHARSEAC